MGSQVACGSLYPGGHGEERECVRPKGHSGPHEYAYPLGDTRNGSPRFDLWPETGYFETEPKR